MPFSAADRRALMLAATDIADRAGRIVLDVYASDFEVRRKEDSSPVTEADERAEALILPALRDLLPGIPAIGEEAVAGGAGEAVSGETFWLVDPLDGTKEFLRRNGEFTVNIALVDGGGPVLGVVTAPALGTAYRACGAGTAEKRAGGGGWSAVRVRPQPAEGLTVVASRSHGDPARLNELAEGMKIAERLTVGSSLKFCLLAEGTADIYPRYGPTSEWDTAAGHAVLLGAGGSVALPGGEALSYGKPGWRNPEFIARGAR